MKLILLILSALALVAQTPPSTYKISPSGFTSVGTLAVVPAATAYLTIDDTYKSRHTSMIVRNSSGEPIAFCNIKQGKCWSFPREVFRMDFSDSNPTLRIYDETKGSK